MAAECGAGRVFVFTCHPESDYDDRTVIEGAFRYVTRGREVRWRYPQRKAGQLAVGFVSDDVFGPETGRLVQRLVKQTEFDIIPVNAKFVEEGALRHFDAVLVPPFRPRRREVLRRVRRRASRLSDGVQAWRRRN